MKQYPEDWDAERIADDQAGGCFLVIVVLMLLVAVFKALTAA